MADTPTNPGGIDMGVAEPSIEERMQAFVNNEPALTEDDAGEAKQEQGEAQGQAQDDGEPTAEDIPGEDEPQAQPTSGDEFELIHNGQQVKLPRDEVIKLAQQGFDYTQKTQQTAEMRRQAEAVLQRAAEVEQMMPVLMGDLAQVRAIEQQLMQFDQYVESQGGMVAIATNDPLEYPKYQAQRDQLMRAYQAAAGQYQQRAQAVTQSRTQLTAHQLQVEAAALRERIPEWKDPEKYAAGAQELRSYLIGQGADPRDVDTLSSSLAVSIARKAMLYDKLRADKASRSKQLRTVPPMTRPGAPSSARAEDELKAEQRLRKTGRREDAVGLLLTRMK